MCRCDLSCLYLLVRCRGTVICRIWIQVLFVTAYAALIAYLYKHHGIHLHVEASSLSVLAVVTGMLLVFRTNTAYDRFWEGRKIWSDLVWDIRTLARTVWVYVDDKKDAKLLVEKVSVLNLCIAFAYAAKHYLREEYSYEEEDIKEFIAHIPRMFMPSANKPLKVNPVVSTSPPAIIRRREKELQKRMLEDSQQLEKLKRNRRTYSRARLSDIPTEEQMIPAETNIPLEISYYITSYVLTLKERGVVDSPFCRVVDTAVGNMVRCLNGCERIRRTPIPLAYSVHLCHVTWIIVLSLPLQWTADLGWMTIPAVCLASFALFGILSIGREIENPFGYDENDLDMDMYCRTLHKEILCLISEPMAKPSTWILSDDNHPIMTDFALTAPTLIKMKYDEVTKILREGLTHEFGASNTTVYNQKTQSKTVLDQGDIPV